MPVSDPQYREDLLSTEAQYIKGVGPARAARLEKLGLKTAGDILYYFPRTYEDLSDVRPIAELTSGSLQTVMGEVVEIGGKTTASGKTLVSIVISDGEDVLEGVWFNQAFMAQKFRYGQRVAFSGKPSKYGGHWQISNPRVQYLDSSEGIQTQPESVETDARVLPVYGLTEGVLADQMRKITRFVAETRAHLVSEIIPQELRIGRQLVNVEKAFHDVHAPATLAAAQDARRRLVYEEFLVLELGLALRRRDIRDREQATPLPVNRAVDERVRRLFPFSLTSDQNRAVREICKDMAEKRPMQRLLQADVGAGKTAVAVYALLLTVANGHQAALMAPTEVLARQHWRTLNQYLAHSRVRRSLLTGSTPAKERRILLSELRLGQVDLAVGTQALIQEDVEFEKLGLVVIDEQHKFGVAQRMQFRKLGAEPHYLILTATPIPRTISLTVFGDLDSSIIREMPPGRKPVTTKWATENQRPRIEGHLREEMRNGRQLYVVCPLVAENEAMDLKAAESVYEHLRDGPFSDFSVGLLHGRVKEQDKDRYMQEFRDKKIDVLVSTLVIEVGVDVPNATLMVIEHADRFGLSQLHQLRGRISRGPVGGECFIFANASTDETKRRLQMFTRISDGFKLAEEDLRLRGMGEFFGTRQHGAGELRIGNLISDMEILRQSREDAFGMVAKDAGLNQPEHAGLREAVIKRYGEKLDLVRIG